MNQIQPYETDWNVCKLDWKHTLPRRCENQNSRGINENVRAQLSPKQIKFLQDWLLNLEILNGQMKP